MPRRTIAHAGFLALALAAVGQLVLEVCEDLALRAATASHDFSNYDRLAKVWYVGWCAVIAAQIAGLALGSFVPRSTGARGPLIAAASLAVLSGLPSFFRDSFWTVATALSPGALRILSGSISLLDVAGDALLLLGVWRIARAWRLRAGPPLCVTAMGLLALRVAFVVARVAKVGDAGDTVRLLHQVVGYAHVVTMMLLTALLAWRLPSAAPPSTSTDAAAPGDASLLPRVWATAAAGTTTYLLATAARVVFALLTIVTMVGASSAHDRSDLIAVRDQIVAVAVFSGAASVVMIIGVLFIARAPADAGAAGPAGLAAVLMFFGLLLDGGTTSITADALGGDLSAAFFAQDALPVLALVGALLGIGTAVALLTAFARMASRLARDDVARRARGAMGLVVAAGALGGLALLAAKASTELLGLLAVVALPLAVAATVQFLRVAIAVSGTIRARLQPA
jgi:hypothetical protein